jgi:hypothetical protein
VSESKSHRHGGAAHQYWVHRLAKQLRAAGYDVQTEAPIGGGKTIDIVATRNGKRIAFEIETGNSDAAANVRKCLAAGLKKVVVVATTRRVRDALASSVPADPRVRYTIAAEASRRFDIRQRPVG